MSNDMSNNKKKIIIPIVFVLLLVIAVVGVTYAFFNYTRTGSANTVKVGRIYFISKNENTINLSNLFPINPNETGIMDDVTKVGIYEIGIEGDTDYSEGLEYLISTTNTHIYTSEGKTVPISINIDVKNLGNENTNYFTARESKDANIYKKLSGNAIVGEQQLLVGYIKPNTTSGTKEGINGSITIKAYFDKDKISISDTYDGTESDDMGTTNDWVDDREVITTEEWNSLSTNGVSFQIKVEANEGIWVDEPFYDVMRRSTVMDNINSTYVNNTTPGIDFSKISSNTNGKGIYTLSSTANDAFPIMYYRGDVDNNVLFGNFCWKVVRTTDTGGIKLIYNGKPVNNQCSNDRIIEKNQIIKFDFNFDQTLSSFGDSYEYDSANKVFRLTGNVIQSSLSIENIDNLINKYFCNDFQLSGICGSLIKVYSYDSVNNEISFKQITQDSSIMLGDNDINKDNVKYNLQQDSPASVGYMYGTNYVLEDGYPNPDKYNAYFGTEFIYENGVYKIVNPVKMSSILTEFGDLNKYHYTCGISDPNATCESIMYYTNFYFSNPTRFYNYITLTNGKDVHDILEEMFTNTNDSLAKMMIDTWYRDNMIEYTSKIEDTIYCNDRSISDLGGWDPSSDATGPSGNKLSFALNGIKCPKKRDSFTVNQEKGNGKLTYPVGMLTNDESFLAGSIYGLENINTNFYLYDGNGFWTMTPNSFIIHSNPCSYIERVYSGGNFGGTRPDFYTYMSGFRPVISLKQGTGLSGGTGTPTDPFVFE